jgi:two-component system chemotaxis response regulator CheB
MSQEAALAQKIRVLVAEDSPVMRKLLVHLLESDAAIQVIGEVADGQAAVEFVQSRVPDLVVMDIQMPRLDGFDATQRIMETRPVPIIVCSSMADTRDLAVVFRAMDAGAIACIEKPTVSAVEDPAKAMYLLDTVKALAGIKVVRRVARAPLPSWSSPRYAHVARAPVHLIAIGASTGGPGALHAVLSHLPEDFPVPILVVQHIAAEFLPGLIAWLNAGTRLKVEIAAAGVQPRRGHVYFAPDDKHMGVDAGGTIQLVDDALESHLRPAASFLFRSVLQTYGRDVIGVLLSGMGRDGANELAAMHARGAFTIAQDEASSIVHGMPGAAIALGAASAILSPIEISQALIELTRRTNTSKGR